MKSCDIWSVVPLVLLCSSLLYCGGSTSSSSNSPPPPPPSTITSVTVSTTLPYAKTEQTIYFTAKVEGTGHFSSQVTWAVNGVTGGDTTNGTISSNGAYTAPATLPYPNVVTITATSVQDQTKSGSEATTIYTLTITPQAVTVYYGHTQQFTAEVTGLTSYTVSWFCGFGMIDGNGLYTAPTSIMGQDFQTGVSASLFTLGAPAQAAITLEIPPAIITSITPNGASANEPVTINGRDLFGLNQIVFPGPNGTIISPEIESWTFTQVTTTLPTGIVSGPVYLELTPYPGYMQNSNSIAFTRLPNLRIRAPKKDLSSSETGQFEYRLLGAASPSTVTWTANQGTIITSGLYQAPVVTKERFTTVTGCLQNTRSCDSMLLRILPLRITPDEPIVGIGDTLQLAAQQGDSQVSAQWSILAGGGSINSSGLFTAPTDPTQAGGVPVSAKSGSATATSSVAVTGAVPGLISRFYDYWDQNNQLFEGTYTDTFAVCGNRAYTVDSGVRFQPPFNVNPPFAAIEVYDITDPKHATWLDAVEAVNMTSTMIACYGQYVLQADVAHYIPQPSRMMLYNMQTSPPTLVSFAYAPNLYNTSFNDGVIYATSTSYETVGETAPLYLVDIRNGAILQSEIDVPLPPLALEGAAPYIAIGNGNLIYAAFNSGGGAGLLGAYDASTSPATLLDSVRFVAPATTRTSAVLDGNLLFISNATFDVSNPVPVQIGTLPTQDVQSSQGTRLVGRGTQYTFMNDYNYKVVDITDPANPVVESTFYDLPSLVAVRGQLVGNYLLGTAGMGGIVAYDLSATGSPIDKSRTGVFREGFVFDQAVSQQTLYMAGADIFGNGGVNTFDISSGIPVFLGSLLYHPNEAFAIQLSGTNAFLGLQDSLKTVNVANPANPVETASTPLPTSALALSGNTLFVGTGDSRLVVLDVTNPNSPTTLASVPIAGPAVTMRPSGTLLLIADGANGLLVFDVSNPASPALLSQFTLNTPVWDSAPSGSVALLAADSAGLVVVDISNPFQVKQLSTTTLEPYYPFPYRFYDAPYSIALSVTTHNGVAWVGTANALGLIYGFDYAQPANPRLVAMVNLGEFVDSAISSFTFSGSDMYAAGSLGVLTGVVQLDISSPRDVIKLEYPPQALRGTNFSAQHGSQTPKTYHHPKFDRSMWVHPGRRKLTVRPQTKDFMCHACRR